MGSKSTDVAAYHVVPRPDGGWAVRRGDGSAASRGAVGKAQAIDLAQRLARRRRQARVVVHARDFSVENEWTWRSSGA